MSKTITVGGVDRTSVIRLAGQIWVEAAYFGEGGMGGFDLSDEGGLLDVPALKPVTVDESVASGTRLFTGYTLDRDIARGQYRVGPDRAWDVTVIDLNTQLDDILLTGAAANRPEETDYARITWLLGTTAMAGIAAGVVPNTNTVTMDAVDYRGVHPRRVLEECAEAAAKNFFLYNHDGTSRLYYDKHDGTSLTSALRLSTVLADVDNVTTFGMAMRPGVKRDPTRVYSTVRYTYANGTVKVTNATTATSFRTREFAIVDKTVKTEAKAIAKANQWLADASTEVETLNCGVNLPMAKVNDIRAGQRIQVKAPHLGITAFTYYRCTRREVQPRPGNGGVSDVEYAIVLEFAPDTSAARFSGTHPDTYGGSPVDDGTGATTSSPEGGTCGAADEPCGHDHDADYSPIGHNHDADYSPIGHAHDPNISAISDTPAARDCGAVTFGAPSGVSTVDRVGLLNAGDTGSALGVNVPWPETPCGVGLGAWVNAGEREQWHPANVPLNNSYLGIEVTITGDVDPGGNPGGYYLGYGGTAVRNFGEHDQVSGINYSGTFRVFIPASFIAWNAVNYFVTSPAWQVPQPGMRCVINATPTDSGEGGSGAYVLSLTACAVKFTAGTTGAAGWVPGTGATNGLNKTFTLVSWSGIGPVEAMVNGVPAEGLVLDRAAFTATFETPPPPDSIVLFNYNVAA